MPPFSQTQLSYKARNANTVVLMIGAQPVAFGQTVSHSFDFGTESLFGIGTAKIQEIQQLRVSPTISVEQLNLTFAGASLIQSGSTTPLSSLLANNSLNISVVDSVTGDTVFTYVGCVSQAFSEAITSNQPITDTYTFQAMDVWDSTGQSILNGPNGLTVAQ